MEIKINGKKYKAKAGQTVLDVARENGIYIPNLCYHAKTGKAGKCRACVGEIEGMKGLQTTCTVEAKDGLSITLNSKKVLGAQRLVVDLMLSSGKHDCLSCEKSGVCELQEAAYYLGIERPSFTTPDDVTEKYDDSSELIIRDDSKCIKCGRCVAGCNTTVVNEVLDFGYRSGETKVICDDDLPMGDSSCVQCGECSQICPVGAIIDKKSKGKGRPWELKKVDSVCAYCGVGCQMTLHVNEKSNSIIKVTGVEGAPTNNGMLCVKGRYGYDFVNSPERLTKPLLRDQKGGKLREASWEEVNSYISKKFLEIKKTDGTNAIAGLASAKVTNEENFAFQKFFRQVIGNHNVDHCARL
jgi:predicted molibdopterin-dependent oxidoreductase YjgC